MLLVGFALGWVSYTIGHWVGWGRGWKAGRVGIRDRLKWEEEDDGGS